jgi:thiol-disulfide isomerase/thioredoxin
VLALLISHATGALAQMSGESSGDDQVTIFLFFRDGCPHCAEEKQDLQKLEQGYPWIRVYYLNAVIEKDRFARMADIYNVSTSAVPMTFIGDDAYVGYTRDNGSLEEVNNAYLGYKNQILNDIVERKEELGITFDPDITASDLYEYIDSEIKDYSLLHQILLSILVLYILSLLVFHRNIRHDMKFRRHWIGGLLFYMIIMFFIFIMTVSSSAITNFAYRFPFPLFVFIIALADGFNPCAFTVLVILLSLLTYTKNKRTMSYIGSIFIITSAVMYFIFIMAMIMLTTFAIDKWGTLIMMILGFLVLAAGAINLKDYFYFKKGVSLSISEKNKSRIMVKARKIVNMLKDKNTSLLLALGGTIALAVFVNLVELGCTAILPLIYSSSLSNSYGTQVTAAHVLWTAFYAIIYIIPLLVILINFIYTFKSSRVSEKEGKILKLFSGLLMVLFGLILILRPSLLTFG